MVGQLCSYWWIFVVLGIFAGIISGTLGLGAGTILVPALVLLCGYGQKSAQGMALAVMVPMALVGALWYWRNPEVEMNAAVIGLIICGALAGALFGAELASHLPSHVLRRAFAIFLIMVAVRMFIIPSRPKKAYPGDSVIVQKEINLVEPGDIDNEASNW